MKVYAIIPARYASTRFPGKPLTLISGKPMIQRVYERALKIPDVDRVLIAADDARILAVVEDFGGEAVMTRLDHTSGTDRLAEVVETLNADPMDIVVNIQGDQPAFGPDIVSSLIQPLKVDADLAMTTPAVGLDPAKAEDPNLVKVVFDHEFKALYFSRAPIPWPRDGNRPVYFRHIGIYGYRVDFLRRFVALPPGRLEKIEQLEQLRALENGYAIKIILTDSISPDVDVPDDVARVEAYLAREVEKN